MTMHRKREITRADILPIEVYGRTRKDTRAAMVAAKRNRRLAVGPFATFHFESFDTMLYQVHEMLWTERGGDEQLADELAAYNPLVPNGNDLVATVMLEIEDPDRRARILAGLGGIEETIAIEVGGQRIAADWEKDVDRTTPDGKTSSVHFLHFHFTHEQAKAFKEPGARAMVTVGHPNYGHAAVIPEAMRVELATDLD